MRLIHMGRRPNQPSDEADDPSATGRQWRILDRNSFAFLKQKLPGEVLDALKSLENKEYPDSDFRAAIATALGSAFEKYGEMAYASAETMAQAQRIHLFESTEFEFNLMAFALDCGQMAAWERLIPVLAEIVQPILAWRKKDQESSESLPPPKAPERVKAKEESVKGGKTKPVACPERALLLFREIRAVWRLSHPKAAQYLIEDMKRIRKAANATKAGNMKIGAEIAKKRDRKRPGS